MFPNLLLNLAVAFILSSILSVIWVVLADAVDVTLSDPEDVAKRLDVQVLGVIPATRNLMNPVALATADDGANTRSGEALERFRESIRGLRTSIGLANLDRPVRSLLVTSAQPSEGKSTTAANLALSFAQVGKRVLLVDADLRAPSIHKHFDTGTESGLSDVLAGRVSWQDVMVRIDPWELMWSRQVRFPGALRICLYKRHPSCSSRCAGNLTSSWWMRRHCWVSRNRICSRRWPIA